MYSHLQREIDIELRKWEAGCLYGYLWYNYIYLSFSKPSLIIVIISLKYSSDISRAIDMRYRIVDALPFVNVINPWILTANTQWFQSTKTNWNKM